MDWLNPQLEDHFKSFFPRLAKNKTFPADGRLCQNLRATCRRWRKIFPLHQVYLSNDRYEDIEGASTAVHAARCLVAARSRNQSANALRDVLKLAASSETLRKVCIFELRVKANVSTELSDALGALPNLVSLELFRVCDTSGQILAFLPTNSSIQRLHCDGRTDMESPVLKFVALALQSRSCGIRKLTCIGRMLRPPALITLSQGIALNASLRKIRIRALAANDDSVEQLGNAISCCKSLRKVDVVFQSISVPAMSNFVDALRKNSSCIESVSIENSCLQENDVGEPIFTPTLSASSLIRLLEPNTALQSLAVPSARMEDFLPAFSSCKSISNSLTRLVLRSTGLKAAEIVSLFRVLQTSADGLLELFLNDTIPSNPSKAGCDAISHYLRSNRPLKALHLGCCYLSASDFAIIASGLEKNKNLEGLYAEYNVAMSAGASAIAEVLAEKNSSLTALDLRGNSIRTEAIESFSKALRQNTSLLQLNLHDNWLKPTGIDALRQARAANPDSRIYFLDIGGCNELDESEIVDDDF
jgi:Ran GTPase-activating protein (RanGAP) involved in mRNA processing and transport